MRYVPTVHDHSLKSGLFVSVGLHTLAFIFLLIELPKLVPPLPAHRTPVPFDIVTIGEITNTKIGNGEAGQAAPPAASPTPPAPAAAPQPPSPQPQAKPEPPQPRPETKPAPPQPKVEDIIEGLKKSADSKKPAEQKKAQSQQDLLGSVLKDVAKLKPSPSGAGDSKSDSKGAAAAQVGSPNGSSSSISGMGTGLSHLSITEEDALRRQIEQCWNPPVGARNAEELIVEVVIDVNADRTVANADIVDKGRYASDPFFRAAADAAIRALRNPRCSPLELAPDKYEQWKRINFTFDPRDML